MECTVCEVNQDESNFYLLSNGKRRAICISCVSEYNKRYYAGERIGRDRKVDDEGNLECYRCHVWQHPDCFGVNHTGKADSYCKPCRREYQKEWAIQKKYGLSLLDLNKILLQQMFACKICKRDLFIDSPELAVDHDHETGEVRGILCTNCNAGLGLFKDDPEILESAIRYLRGSVA